MINETLSLGAAFMFGLLGSTHCLGMCGGVMAALSMNSQKQTGQSQLSILLSYNMGRICSYAVAGVLVCLLGLWLQELHASIGLVIRLLSAILLILMGFYLTGWWRILTLLEQAGENFWKYLQPIGSRLMPVRTVPKAFLLGIIWGWLPCGLVYSVLGWSATSANIVEAALIMLFFGLGTLPSLMATGIFADKLYQVIQKRLVRITSGLLIIIFGLWMLAGTVYYMLGHQGHGTHGNHTSESEMVVPEGHHH